MVRALPMEYLVDLMVKYAGPLLLGSYLTPTGLKAYLHLCLGFVSLGVIGLHTDSSYINGSPLAGACPRCQS
jgi:hypothetical protein